MTITKKDTIILAVLFNIVILAGVIATAHQLSSKPEAPPREKGSSQQQCATEEKDLSDRYVPQEEGALAFDEIDQLLEEYISEEIPETPPPQAQGSSCPSPAPTNCSRPIARCYWPRCRPLS